ncbi:MAG: hypothetical protein LBS24_03775, partial [Clostridiales Family XIII bacterium]|nr:hypothetical protein [Clostridiales Family XIII bacterium]
LVQFEARSALKLLNGGSAGLRASPAAPQNIAAGGLQPHAELYQAVVPSLSAGDWAASFNL